MFITGPDVVKTVTGEEVTFEELGGAMTHASKSGVAHFALPDEEACLEDCALPAQLPAAEQPRDPPYCAEPTDPRPAAPRALDTLIPTTRTSPTT
jgi:acetyl-CoA carboxylase carboxyltransferase component